MRICEEGPAPENFDSQPVLERWTDKCATQRRLNIMPSGPRASGLATATKRKLPESQVAQTVKKLIKDSDIIESDSSNSEIDNLESDSELEDLDVIIHDDLENM